MKLFTMLFIGTNTGVYCGLVDAFESQDPNNGLLSVDAINQHCGQSKSTNGKNGLFTESDDVSMFQYYKTTIPPGNLFESCNGYGACDSPPFAGSANYANLNGPYDYSNRDDCISRYPTTRPKLEHDFTDENGDPAPFASGYPKNWGSESQKINLPASPLIIALSLEQTLLAVGIDTSAYIYNLTTFEPVQVIKAGGVILVNLAFQPKTGSNKLVTTSLCLGVPRPYLPEVRVWDLDEEKRANRSYAYLLEAANLALDVAASVLKVEGRWTEDDVKYTEIHAHFSESIRLGQHKVDVRNRDVLPGSVFSGKSAVFAMNGSMLLYTDDGTRILGVDISESTRPPQKISIEVFVGYISAIATNANGTILATSVRNPNARGLAVGLYDLYSGNIIASLKDPEVRSGAWYYSFAFSPDGKYLAAGYDDHLTPHVALWRVDTGELVKRITGFPAEVGAIEFSPDSRYLAAGSIGMLKVVDLEGGNDKDQLWKINVTETRTPIVFEVANQVFTEDNVLIFSMRDGQVYGFDLKTKKKLQFGPEFDSGSEYLPNFVLSDNGSKLIVADVDNTLRAYDLV